MGWFSTQRWGLGLPTGSFFPWLRAGLDEGFFLYFPCMRTVSARLSWVGLGCGTWVGGWEGRYEEGGCDGRCYGCVEGVVTVASG